MTAATIPPAQDWKNLLGVCACLGEDLGFNPIWLRIAFGAGLIWSPLTVISIYLTLGAVVLISRVIAPNCRAAATPVTERVVPVEIEPLPLAA